MQVYQLKEIYFQPDESATVPIITSLDKKLIYRKYNCYVRDLQRMKKLSIYVKLFLYLDGLIISYLSEEYSGISGDLSDYLKSSFSKKDHLFPYRILSAHN